MSDARKTRPAKLHVGTSGWSYPDWRGGLYPEDCAKQRLLEAYTREFDCAELNASFYRLPTENMVSGWVERTPAQFRFCAKLSRYISHIKRLRDPEDTLDVFIKRIAPLKQRLGPLLLQLPPSLEFDEERVGPFLKAFRRKSRGLQLALEARHASWLHDAALGLLNEYDIALVCASSGGHYPDTLERTASFAYFRFHGPEALYASGYGGRRLAQRAKRAFEWLQDGAPVWAFFNNTDGGHAWRDAKKFRELIERRAN